MWMRFSRSAAGNTDQPKAECATGTHRTIGWKVGSRNYNEHQRHTSCTRYHFMSPKCFRSKALCLRLSNQLHQRDDATKWQVAYHSTCCSVGWLCWDLFFRNRFDNNLQWHASNLTHVSCSQRLIDLIPCRSQASWMQIIAIALRVV